MESGQACREPVRGKEWKLIAFRVENAPGLSIEVILDDDTLISNAVFELVLVHRKFLERPGFSRIANSCADHDGFSLITPIGMVYGEPEPV